MDTRDRATLEELSRKIDFLCSLIVKAQQYAKSDPETSLMQARKSAEAICRHIFAVEIGEPRTIMLAMIIVSVMRIQNSARPEVSKGQPPCSCFDT